MKRMALRISSTLFSIIKKIECTKKERNTGKTCRKYERSLSTEGSIFTNREQEASHPVRSRPTHIPSSVIVLVFLVTLIFFYELLLTGEVLNTSPSYYRSVFNEVAALVYKNSEELITEEEL